MWTKYRLRKEDYEALLEKQNSRCAICQIEKSRLHIDHDHKTGKVRGLLCQRCNISIGWFENHASQHDLQSYLGLVVER